jgi:hypothetical protein
MGAGVRWVVALIAVTVSGCATVTQPPAAPGVQQISFELQEPPFCGRCETTKLVATSDGHLLIEVGHWGGNYRNWKRQRSVRPITLEQFAEFKQALDAYRPTQNALQSNEQCANYIHDQAGLLVEWTNGNERRVRVFDFGCADDRAMNEAVQAAPKVLGL